MGTSAVIAKRRKDGSLKAITVHYDGYESHTDKILKEFYKDEEKLDQLLDLGNLSFLEKELWADGHSFEAPVKGVTIAYGRDRGEKRQGAKTFETESKWRDFSSGEPYVYVWTDGVWKNEANLDRREK
jgi:hypothetical protein